MEAQNDLCANCETIDFESLLVQTFDGWTKVARLEWLKTETSDNCYLCKFLRHYWIQCDDDVDGAH